MAENIIESLVVQLGLDASGLNEEAAKSAIGNIQKSVVELNTALKETKDLLGAIGNVGQRQQSNQRSAPAQVVNPATVTPTVPAQVAPVQAATVTPTVPAQVAPVQAATVTPTAPTAATVMPTAPAPTPVAADDKQATREEEARKRREVAFQKWKGKQEMRTATALRSVANQTTSKGLDRIISGVEDRLANLDKAESSGNMSGHQARVQRGLLNDVLKAAQERRGVVVRAESDKKTEDDKKAEEAAAASAAERAERIRQRSEREAQRQRDRNERRRMPTSLGGLLRGIPGLGHIAAGLYIARQAFDAVAGFVGKITDAMKGGQDIRTAAQSFGIATDRMQGFTDAAVQFGANSNEIAQDMAKFMSSAQIPIGGQYHWGLARKGVAVSEGGQWRKMEDIMGDLADVMSKEPKLNKDTYNYYRHMFGFSKQTVDYMQQGRAGIEEMRKVAISSGLALSQPWVEAQADQAKGWAITKKELGVFFTKAGIVLSSIIQPGGEAKEYRARMAADRKARGGWWGIFNEPVVTPWEREKAEKAQSVRPDAQHVNGSTNQKTSQQVTVNVSVDKSGAATTSVKGVDRKNVSTNVYPYKVAQ